MIGLLGGPVDIFSEARRRQYAIAGSYFGRVPRATFPAYAPELTASVVVCPAEWPRPEARMGYSLLV